MEPNRDTRLLCSEYVNGHQDGASNWEYKGRIYGVGLRVRSYREGYDRGKLEGSINPSFGCTAMIEEETVYGAQ